LWPKKLGLFVHHSSKLSIVNGIIVFGGDFHTLVVPFHQLVEVTLVLHHNLAHVGYDKLFNLLFNLVWHPAHYKTVQDVCGTCHHCQINKEISTVVVPPTLKISTSRPFELVAADLISLPWTRSGFVGCLMVVEH
jgi:hypothetical protein